MQPMLRLPSLRGALLRVHSDLFAIEQKSVWVFLGDKLSTFEIMVLALEDRRFFRHIGVDVWACARELVKLICRKKHGGASTVDMQFVRTVTGYREQTLRRKCYEILLAILIQFKYRKLEILRSYLAHAFFGSHLIGAETASERIFGKETADLSEEEASCLAAMLVYPKPLTVTPVWRANVERRAKYGRIIYARIKQRFEKLPVRETT